MNVLEKNIKTYLSWVGLLYLLFVGISTAQAQIEVVADCTTGKADVSTITDATATPPANTVLTLHTALPTTNANRVGGATATLSNATSVDAGTYYVAYYSTTEYCYSTQAAKLIVAGCVKADCSTNQANLSTTYSANNLNGKELTWHTSTPATNANKIADVTAVSPGAYYAAVYDSAQDCYSDTSGMGGGNSTTKVYVADCVEVACPSTTVDLDAKFTSTATPAGAELTFHSGSPATDANRLTQAQIDAAPKGMYFAAYRHPGSGSGNECYSDPSGMGGGGALYPICVVILDCPETKNDIAQTPQDTPVSGNVLTNDKGITKVTSVTVGGTTTPVPATGTVDVAVTGGTLTIASDGSYTFTPTTGFTGQVPTITYEGEDANGAKQTATLDIDVIPNPVSGNDAPVANDDTNTVKQGETVTTNVLANDSDPDGDTLSIKPSSVTGLNDMGQPVTLTAAPQNVYVENPNNPGTFVKAGQASVDASGNIVFTADANFTGDVPFNYTAQDGNGGEASATAVITVKPSTEPNSTVANDDANTSIQGQSQTGNVLTNDSDPEGDAQTVKEIKVLDASGNEITVPAGTSTPVYAPDPNNAGQFIKAGSITVNSDGTYSYSPEPTFVGTAPVKYVAEDTNGNTDTATLNLTTLKSPVVEAKNDIAQTPQDTPVSGNVLTNDKGITKVTGVTVAGLPTPVAIPPTGTETVNLTEGTLTIASDGSYTFTPANGFTGQVPTITYDGEDVNGAPQTATLDIDVIPNPVSGNDAPVANDDTNTVKQGQTVTTNVLANDSDPDGDTLSIKPNSVIGLDMSGNKSVVLTGTPQNVYDVNGTLAGQASVDTSGNIVFTADANFTGDVPFDYTAQDGKTGEASATAVITVKPSTEPNSTVANDDANTSIQGESQAGNVLANDSDPEGDGQTVKEVKVLDANGNEVTVPAGTSTPVYAPDPNNAGQFVKAGSITVNSDGTYSYSPEPTFIGTAPVKYVAEDTNGNTDTATLNLTTLKSPVVETKNDIAQTPQDTPVSGNVLTNDKGITKVTSVTVGGTTTPVPATGTVDVPVTGGTLTIASDGSYTFTPTAGFTGQVPPITYEGEDASGAKQTATLDIDVIPNPVSGNDAPVANDDTNTVKQGQTVTTNVLANDSDPDGDTLSIKPNSVTGLDMNGSSVVLTGTPQNVYDANGTLAGQASVDTSGNIVFTADANFTGDVPFNYTAQDGNGGEASATAVITVKPSAEPNSTVANDDANTSIQGETQTGNVLTNDSDPEGDAQTVKEVKVLDANGNEVTVPAGTSTPVYAPDPNNAGQFVKAGSITVNSDGTYSYIPEPSFIGTAPVKYVAEDTNGNTDTATLNLTTLKSPVVEAKNDIAQTPQDIPVVGNVLTNDTGIIKVTSVTVNGTTTPVPATGEATVSIPGKGTLIIKSDGSFTFNPAAGFTGAVPPITYEGEDANGNKKSADLAIKVIPNIDDVNNTKAPPVANDDTNTVKQGDTVTTKVLENDNDLDSNTISIKPNSVTGLNAAGSPVAISTSSASPTTVYDENGVEAGTAYVDETTGEIVFTAKSDYVGDVPFNYTAQDSDGGESDAKAVITVKPNNAPSTLSANDDANLGEVGAVQTGNVINNDANYTAGQVSVSEIRVLDANGNEVLLTPGATTTIYAPDPSNPGQFVPAGEFTMAANGAYTYTPLADYVGTAPVTYQLRDASNGNTAKATLNLTTVQLQSRLPVKLIAFNADLVGNDVELTWASATEENHASYVIELSLNGINFSKIGEVEGAGNSFTKVEYAFLHKNATDYKAKKLYYRLKMVSDAGEITYSVIQSVELANIELATIIYPNPAQAGQSIMIESSNIQSVKIFGINGQIIRVLNFPESDIVSIDTRNMKAGIYNILINDTIYKKVVIVK